jgi:hypothetical protein
MKKKTSVTRGASITLGLAAFIAAMVTGPGTGFAKLNAAPGKDGAPSDPQTEAEVDALNDALDGDPEGNQSDDFELAHAALYDQPTQCPMMAPPTGGECSSLSHSCSEPCVYETNSCDINTLPFAEAEGLYDLVYSLPTKTTPVNWEMVDLAQYAWALLYDNLDLVEWTSCVWYGESATDDSFFENLGGLFGVAGSLAECVSDKIQGKAPDVTIMFQPSIPNGAFSTTPNPLTGGTIHIPISGNVWNKKYVDKFDAAAPGSAGEFCIVADLAATLLHELVHSCLTGGSLDTPVAGDSANTCSTSYLIENSLRWALGKRYPCLLSTSDCGYYGDSRLFRNDGASYPGQPPF